jgi:hypothetical protein
VDANSAQKRSKQSDLEMASRPRKHLPDARWSLLSGRSNTRRENALIRALWAKVQSLTAPQEARLAEPGKTPDKSSLPLSKGHKPNKPEHAAVAN